MVSLQFDRIYWNSASSYFMFFFNMLYVQYNYRIAQSHMFLQQNSGKVLTKVSSSIWFYFWWTDTLCIINLALIGKENTVALYIAKSMHKQRKQPVFLSLKLKFTWMHFTLSFVRNKNSESKLHARKFKTGMVKILW